MHVFPNDKIYVGITSKEPEKRWLKDGYGYRNQQLVYSAIKKYGWDNIQHVIVARNVSYESAKNIEIDLISLYDTNNRENGYNISPGGDLISEESRKKISISRIGQHPTEEARRKMSEGRKGKKKSIEHRRKIGEAHKGKKMSEEFCKKMSEIAKNRHRDTDKDPRNIPVLQYRISDGEFVARYVSAPKAGRELGVNYSHIHECAKDKRRQVADCVWIYEKDATEEYVQYRLKKARFHAMFRPVVISKDSSYSNSLYCESVSMAARFLGFSETSVSHAALSHKFYNGYYFKRISVDEYLGVLNS